MPRRSNTEDNPLLIDRAAAADLPSVQALAEWASDKRVFISGVMSELIAERNAAANAIRAVGAHPVMFEEFGGRDADPEQAYLAELESSDIYLGILGRRYGKPLKSKFSATHTEYLHAEKHGLRIAIWAIASDDREGHEEAFLNEVRTFYVAQQVQSVADLERQIRERITSIAAEDLAPWCKLRNIVFRATKVTNRGNEIEVAARVRNDEVAHNLEQLRPDRLSNGEEGRFTWQGRSKQVKVRSVETTTTSARSVLIRMILDVVPSPQSSMIEVSFAGMSRTDLTESALRSALFGERNPLLRDHLGFLSEMADPFESLREHPVSEETLRPIAELMLTDELVGSGRAERIASFRLGVETRGHRKCEVTWQIRRRFANEKDEIRKIEGSVEL
jgi:Domain of unknown function (DUF4062)